MGSLKRNRINMCSKLISPEKREEDPPPKSIPLPMEWFYVERKIEGVGHGIKCVERPPLSLAVKRQSSRIDETSK